MDTEKEIKERIIVRYSGRNCWGLDGVLMGRLGLDSILRILPMHFLRNFRKKLSVFSVSIIFHESFCFLCGLSGPAVSQTTETGI